MSTFEFVGYGPSRKDLRRGDWPMCWVEVSHNTDDETRSKLIALAEQQAKRLRVELKGSREEAREAFGWTKPWVSAPYLRASA